MLYLMQAAWTVMVTVLVSHPEETPDMVIPCDQRDVTAGTGTDITGCSWY